MSCIIPVNLIQAGLRGHDPIVGMCGGGFLMHRGFGVLLK